jgi:hypothetical protein
MTMVARAASYDEFHKSGTRPGMAPHPVYQTLDCKRCVSTGSIEFDVCQVCLCDRPTASSL